MRILQDKAMIGSSGYIFN